MSILRSSKFVRYFVTFARNIAITQPHGVDSLLLKQCKSLSISAPRTFSEATTSPGAVTRIEKSIQRLDQDVRRAGRISSKELLEVFDEIRQSRHATGTQSLMIIRCCGNLVPDESPKIRTKLVNEIWETFEKIGVPFDISHYNALLRVYIENEHQFSPTEFLSKLEEKGIEPNRVTFQRLVAAFCQKGDIEGATTILSFMKDKQIPVNVSIFNSLITGHSQANDMESAEGILGVMNQSNLKPTSETYTALLSGFAKKGDMEAIKRLFIECADQEIELIDRDVLEVAYSLAINDHSHLLDDLFVFLQKKMGYNQDAKNLILRLIVQGKDDAALKVLKSMTSIQSADGEEARSGTFLVKQMVKSMRPVETILSVCEQLKSSGANPDALLFATETSLHQNNPEMSLRLLSALAKEEDPVCQHYYWPVLVQYGKAKNLEGIKKTVRQMIEEVKQPASGETVRDYIIPYCNNDRELLELRSCGIPLATAASSLVCHLLLKGDLKAAAQSALKYRANYNNLYIRRAVVSAFFNSPDIPSLVTLVQAIDESESDDDCEATGKILLDLAQGLKKRNAALFQPVLEKFFETGLGISNEMAEEIQNVLTEEKLTPEISTLLSKLSSQELSPTKLMRPRTAARYSSNEPDLDEDILLRLIKTAEAKNDNVEGLKKQLLTFYCRNKNLDKAVALKEELDRENVEYSVGSYSLLLDLFVHHNKLKEALDYYGKIKQINTNGTDIDEIKIVRLVTLMINEGKFDEAISILKENKSKTEQSAKSFTFNSTCWKLLNIFAEKGDDVGLRTVFNALIDNGYIEANNVLLGPLVKVHLVKDDLEGALKEFEECCTMYRATPWKNEIACRLIQKEDAVALQKLTDLSTQIHGEVNSLYDLVLSFIECGRIRQARKILETPGLRTRNLRLNSACERYNNEGKVNHIENLVEVTKDFTHINRSDLYYHLLCSYCKSDEVNKASALWTQMQDEDVQPTDSFLIKLGNLLNKHNMTVPFKIPDIIPADVPSADKHINQGGDPLVKNMRAALNGKEVDEALACWQRVNPSETTVGDRSKLLNLLLNSGRLGVATKYLVEWLETNRRPNVRCINAVVNAVAKAGDIDTLNTIGKHLNKDLKKMVSFTNRYTHCMVEAGKTQEVLSMLLEMIRSANTPEEIQQAGEEFPRGGIYSVFEASAEHLPTVETLASEYRAKGLLGPTNILWIYHTMNGNNEEAEKIWPYLRPKEALMFQPIIKLARKNKDIALVERLLEKVKDSGISKSGLAVIHGCLIDIEISLNRIDEALERLDHCSKDIPLELLSHAALIRLKNECSAVGKDFNYTIPPKKLQKQASSSSSSDSDDEEMKKPMKQ